MASRSDSEIPTSNPSLPGAPLSGRAAGWALALILGVVFLAYIDTLWFQFVHDDRPQIVGNTWLRAWKYVPRYFTAHVWAFEHPVSPGNFYRPLFLFWFRLQYLIFGLHPWGWHLCTLLCHLVVTLLVFYTAVRLLDDRLAALFAALIFGLHPTHAEAVAWVSGVTEPLFAAFLLASYLCYLKQRTDLTRAKTFRAVSLVLYVLASLAKETAVILPILIFGSELLFRARPRAPGCHVAETAHAHRQPLADRPGNSARDSGDHRRLGDPWRALLIALPYFAIFAVYLGARLYALRGFQNTTEAHSYKSMFMTWPAVLWFYLRHLMWPAQLSPFYSMDFSSQISLHTVLLPALAVLMAGVGLWVWGKRSVQAALATLWLVIPILPVLNLRVFIEGHLVHDRYLYLPSVGFSMLAALALRRLRLPTGLLLGQPAIQLGLASILALALGLGVVRSTACYANQTTFFTYVAEMAPKGYGASMDLASLLGNQGHVDEAISIYRKLWPEHPEDWDLNYNLGYACYLTGKLGDADRYLSRAVQIDPTRPDGFLYLGLTKLKLGDVNAAAANIQRAVIIRPDALHYHFALGVIFKLQGNLPGALSEFHQEMDLDPDNASARQQAQEIEATFAAAQKATPPNSATSAGASTTP